jgi:hypothetical protein
MFATPPITHLQDNAVPGCDSRDSRSMTRSSASHHAALGTAGSLLLARAVWTTSSGRDATERSSPTSRILVLHD